MMILMMIVINVVSSFGECQFPKYLFKGNFDLKGKTIIEAGYVLDTDPEYDAEPIGVSGDGIFLYINYGGEKRVCCISKLVYNEDGEIESDDLAERLMILLSEKSDFDTLYSIYKKFQSAFCRKYGKPTESRERFNYPWSFTDSNQIKTEVLHEGECVIYTKWEDDRDMIELFIAKDGRVKVNFCNKNNALKRFEKQRKNLDSSI